MTGGGPVPATEDPVPTQGVPPVGAGGQPLVDTRYESAWDGVPADEADSQTFDPRGTERAREARAGGDAPVGGWSQRWEQRFRDLKLAPADIEYLRTSGYDDTQLLRIARELESQPLIDPSGRPVGGQGTGGVGSGQGSSPPVSGPTGPEAGGSPGWGPRWESRFRDVLTRLGMSKPEVDAQLAQASQSGLSETQLQGVYDELKGALGDWSPEWEKKFRAVLDAQKVPAAEQAQVIAGLAQQGMKTADLQKLYDEVKGSAGAFDAGWEKKFRDLLGQLKVPADQQQQVIDSLKTRGLSATDLQKFYDEIASQKPGWSSEWENRFKTLGLPEEMMKQLKESNSPEAGLKETFDKLLKTKLDYQKNGRLKKLEEADASSEEKWGVMMSEMSDSDFDKTVEAIHSQHVPLWKRGLSIALNLIPGVGTLQYITGSDWVTGEKIDRTNPLNIGMAVLSAIPAIGYIKGGVQAIRGAGMLTGALKAGTAGAGVTQALTGAGLVGKFSQGLSILDKVKMVTPIVNKFGEAGKLYQFSRGFYQGSKFLAAATALKTADGARAFSDDAVRYMNDTYVFRQKPSLWGNVMSPLKNNAVVDAARVGSQGARYTDILLGSAVNVQSAAGIATIRGTANAAGIAAQQAAGFAVPALNGASRQATEIAKVASELGVGQGSRFRSLLQLPRHVISPTSEVTARQALSEVAHTGRAWDLARGVGSWARNSYMGPAGVAMMLSTGVATGQTGRSVQPMWDMYKNRDEYAAQQQAQSEQSQAAAQEDRRQLEEAQRIADEMNAQGGGSTQPADPTVVSYANDPYATYPGDPYAAAESGPAWTGGE